MDNKSYVVQMNNNGVHGKKAINTKSLNGTGVNGNGVSGNDIHQVSVNRGIYPAKAKSRRQTWDIKPSEMANNTLNPIRAIVDGMKLTPNPDKPMIALSIGEIALCVIDMYYCYVFCLFVFSLWGFIR